MPQGLWSLSGGAYWLTLVRAALPSSAIFEQFCFEPQLENPSFSLETRGPKIKNPASSAGHNPDKIGVPRETRQDLPCAARKVPHSRIWLLPYRPDRESPEHFSLGFVSTIPRTRPAIWESSEPFAIIQKHSYASSPWQNFFSGFSSACGNRISQGSRAIYRLLRLTG